MKKKIDTSKAPSPSGTYSQAIQVGHTIYLAGQIPLEPNKPTLISQEFTPQVKQVFDNMQQVCQAAGGSLDQIVKLTIYLIDLQQFSIVNEVMAQYFCEPYPARTTIAVSALPKGAQIEVDAIMVC